MILKDRRTTVDGHETQFQTNHLGHFLLTNLLRDQLVASAPSRVVIVSSDAHRYARKGVDFDDLESTHRYRAFKTYGRTKLMNLLFMRELARRLDGTGVTANAVHPGYVATRFSRDGDTGFMGNVGMVLGRPFAKSPEVGAQTSVFVASAPQLDGVTGQYFAKSRLAKPASDGDRRRRGRALVGRQRTAHRRAGLIHADVRSSGRRARGHRPAAATRGRHRRRSRR